MHAIIKNFRGISDAEISIAPIALICGVNGQGKTSIARAIGAAACQRAVPFDKLTKKDSGIMLRHGTKSGSVMLAGDDGSTTVSWPKGEITSDGSPIVSSQIAVGLIDFLTMKEDAQLAYLIQLLNAEPTEADFHAETKLAGIDEKASNAVWKVISDKDWVSAHRRAVETGQQLKGAWQQVTGFTFGTSKFTDWFPEDWHDSMKEVDVEILDSRITQLKKELEGAIGKSAVSQAERDRLKALVASIPSIEASIDEKTLEHTKLKDELTEVEKLIADTPNPSPKKQYECPHCEKPLQITAVSGMGDFRLTKLEEKPLSAAEIDKRQAEIAKLCGKQQNRSTAVGTVNLELNKLKLELQKAKDAEKTLELPVVEAASPEAIQQLRDKITQVEKTKKLRLQYDEATRYAEKIKMNLKIVELLAETGIRKTKLSKEIDRFVSDLIDPICSDMGTPIVSIDADLNVEVGATPFQMLSAAEQFKARTALQLAIAKKENAAIVIVDGADIIVDGKSRGALLTAINNCDFKGAVVCMSIQKVDKAPDLAAMGVGVTYWVESGKCRIIGEERAAA